MSNPSTFKAEPEKITEPGWDDFASLHRSNDGGGLLSDLKSVRQDRLAELVRFVSRLPKTAQSHYAIEKAGDHRLEIDEILALSRRSDFPG